MDSVTEFYHFIFPRRPGEKDMWSLFFFTYERPENRVKKRKISNFLRDVKIGKTCTNLEKPVSTLEHTLLGIYS